MNPTSVETGKPTGPGADKGLWEVYRSAPPGSLERREIRTKLVERYLHLVRFAARRMSVSPPRELEYEDLLSFGKMGLLDAIEKFDPSLGFAFSTYAIPRIRGAILDELRRFDWISRSGREKIETFVVAREEESRLGGEVSHERVRCRLGASEEEYRQLLRLVASSTLGCLDEWVALEEGEADKAALLADDGPGPQDVIERQDESDRLYQALGKLEEREKELINLYYFRFWKFREIAEEFGLSESRVSQLHRRILQKLRRVVGSAALDEKLGRKGQEQG
ncbi:MAG: sigma-70 family RNA polymerase sigma factor [Synergistales bacterium]